MVNLLRYTYIASLISISFSDYTCNIPSSFGLSSMLSTFHCFVVTSTLISLFFSLPLSLPLFHSFFQKMWRILVEDVNTTIFWQRRSPDTRIILYPGSGKMTYLGCKYVWIWNALEICPVGGTLPSLYAVSETCLKQVTKCGVPRWVWVQATTLH
jgi:hypothetical protein